MATKQSDPPTSESFELVIGAALDWIGEVAVLAKNEAAGAYSAILMEPWRETSPDVFHRIQEATYHWGFSFIEKAQLLVSYESLLTAFSQDPIIARQLNRHVGSVLSSMLLEPSSLARALLPNPTTDFANEVAIRQHLAEQLRSLLTDYIDIDVLIPFRGLHYSGESIALDTTLRLDRATKEEIARLLDLGCLTPVFAGSSVHQVSRDDVIIMRGKARMPKRVGEPGGDSPSDDEITESMSMFQQYTVQAPEELLQCIALLTDKPVETLGYIQNLASDSLLAMGTQYSIQPRPGHSFTALDLDIGSNLSELLRFWNRVRKPKTPLARAYTLAMRRLSYATQRIRPEDRILDIMIAAEALYLSELGSEQDRGELRFRLSHRAAILAEPYSRTGKKARIHRRRVFDVMRLAYDARSSVAHGGDFTQLKQKLDGSAISLPELIIEVETVLRAALAEVLEDGRIMDWNSLVFPPAL
jgi:hypothetical protein